MLRNKLFSFLKGFGANWRNATNSSSSTIFALSSGQGKCGVAVIRISGGEAGNTLKMMTNLKALPKPREALLKTIRDPKSGEILDKGLVLWFPSPNSFTGEDSCELQIHGGIAVVTAVLNALGSIHKLQLARPGEFTRRAFDNGKLDLTEVEGLADLLQAETEVQRKQALLQTQGALSKLYNAWRHTLIQSLAHIEAHIDFEETETLEHNILAQIQQDLLLVNLQMMKHLNDGRKGERLRNGVRTVILGDTNVGKSSLLNVLSQRPAAIVTPLEGTTRDVLEVTLDIGGYPLVLADTAGLRSNAQDIVEREGITRAIQCYETADLILLVIDAVKYSGFIQTFPTKSFVDYIQHYVQQLGLTDFINADDGLLCRNGIVIVNKIDLIGNCDFTGNVVSISCKTEAGFPQLLDLMKEQLKDLCGEPSSEHPSMNQIRHRHHLKECLEHIGDFLNKDKISDTAIQAEYLRRALRSLGMLTGKVTTEQLLDVIFRDFCIGK